jgi:RNA polymerase sigma factor (TIGR02999 family)
VVDCEHEIISFRGSKPTSLRRWLSTIMSDVTRILSGIEQGDPRAAKELLPLVYDELRKLAAARLAQEKPGQTLEATALVHEAYLRLVGPESKQRWDSRGHFFGAAAEAMRRILVEQARKKARLKRGGERQRIDQNESELAMASPDSTETDILALDEALTRLAEQHPEKARLVQLRYFAGLTVDQAAEALGISPATADRHWTYARVWLLREMSSDGPG